MSVTACSRRLSGSICPRALSLSSSTSQPLALISSNTISSLEAFSELQDALELQETLGSRISAKGSNNALASADAPAVPSSASAFAALGVGPPMRRSLRNDENIADHTFRRHTSSALLWRPGLPNSLRSSSNMGMNVLADPSLNTPSQTQTETQALPLPTHLPGGPDGGLLLFGLSELELQAQAQIHVQVQVQAQAQPSTHARTPRTVSLTLVSPLPPSLPQDTHHCALPGIYPIEASEGASAAASQSPAQPLSSSSPSFSSPMPSATSTSFRSFSMSRNPSAMKTSMPPPPAISLPSSSSASLAIPTPPARSASPILSPVLPCLPSPSALHSSLYSPASLAPPSPHPSVFIPESPIAHARRAPSPARTPPMHLHSTPSQHTLTVHLPEGLSPEMVTISAKKGARLAVVADLWHREDDSHYEWEVVFSPVDVDMMSVRAVFEANGQLLIHVRRRMGVESVALPHICAQ